MAVAKMKYLNVSGPEKVLSQTLNAIARCGLFAPEGNEAIHSPVRFGQNQYEPLLTKAKGLLKDLGYSSLAKEYTGDINAYNKEQVSEYLEKFAGEVARRNKRKTEVENELDLQVRTEGLLSHMTDLDINIEELFTVQTMKVRVGRLPKTSYVRLAYYAEQGYNFTSYFNFIVYDFDGEYYWGLYFATRDKADEIDDIFKSLYFERIWVPEFVQGTPGEALQGIRKKIAELQGEMNEILSPTGIAAEEDLLTIQDMTNWLSMMCQLREMERYALVFGRTFYINGFVSVKSYQKFVEQMHTVPHVTVKDAEKDQQVPAKPPVKLKNHWFARPFQMYTEMYGLPSYGEPDPTTMVAWIYSILFGLMFADLGQGIVLGLAGYFLLYRRNHLAVGHILARCAIFSSIFGLLFSSVFGQEELLDPMWHALGFAEKPFEVMHGDSINLILLVSVFIGVLVVSISIITSIITRFRQGRKGQAISSPNGIAGLIFYLGLVFLVVDMMVLHTGLTSNLAFMIGLILLPLLVMYMQEPISQKLDEGKIEVHSVADLLLSGFFELFVTILEFLANTVSFLRVGGFVLAHAGMMSVVNTLAGMSTGVGHILILALGNIFVICLEGLLVSIQALRLNYYEVFSRFYEADGEPFIPLRFEPDAVEL